jgi:hypothetical protein
VKQARLEKHPEGRYYMSHNGQWLDAGTDALEAQRKRKQRLALDEFNRLSGKRSAKSAVGLGDLLIRVEGYRKLSGAVRICRELIESRDAVGRYTTTSIAQSRKLNSYLCKAVPSCQQTMKPRHS